MSGVDSSVTAALLKQQGYDVTGVYMKNWSKDLPGFACPWKQDYQDAKRVAVQLDIPFKMYDFEKNIGKKWWITWSRATRPALRPTRTLCVTKRSNLSSFRDSAGRWSDMIATGHYARIQNGQLKAGLDVNKDQSYFCTELQRMRCKNP